ncbi:MAG: peptidylprolyl isomerase [Candidatus Magasanikbacteria bacterium]
MAEAQEGDTVTVEYTGRVQESGEVFDSTDEEEEPLEFTIGEGNVLPGFERAIIGMEEGEEVTEEIDSDEAFGPHREDMIAEVEKDKFPEDIDLEVGGVLQLPQPDGEYVPVVVKEVGDETVTIDGNHELAGKDLKFDIKLVNIEKED